MPDSRSCGADEGLELRGSVDLVHDGVADVGAIEARRVDRRISQAEPGADVLAGGVVGGGGERDERDAGEQLAQAAELDVLGAEVVAPLRHAVRLVDREERDRERADELERAVEHEALRRHVEQVEPPAAQVAQHLGRLLGRERGVQHRRRNAVRAQRVDLVFHERDERRDHDGRAVTMQRRHLIAERLAATGGHQYERAAPVDDVLDDLALVGPELVVAEDVAKRACRSRWCVRAKESSRSGGSRPP